MLQTRKLRPRGEVTQPEGQSWHWPPCLWDPRAPPDHAAPGLSLGFRNRSLRFLFSQGTQTNGGGETGQQTLGIQEADTQESLEGGERGGGLHTEGGMWT